MILIPWWLLIVTFIMGAAFCAICYCCYRILYRLANAHGQVTGAGGGAKDARIE